MFDTPTLVLGDVMFSDFEIPETLSLGGEQMLALHKLPGGVRVVDAMGPDERDVTWTGRFRGATAVDRAQRLDTLRIQGRQLPLFFDAFRRQVVIKSFHHDVQYGGLEIPYTITLLVVTNDDQPVLETPPSLDELLAADMAEIQVLSATIGAIEYAVAEAQAAYAAVQAVRAGNYSATGALVGAAALAADTLSGPLTSLQTSLVGLSGTASRAIASTAPLISGSAFPASGGSPTVAASALLAASSDFATMANLLSVKAMANRSAVNVGNQLGDGITWTGPAVDEAAQ